MEKVDKIGQLLLKEGVITEQKLQEALDKQKSLSNKPLGEVLIENNFLKENEFLRVLAKQFRTQYVTSDKLANLNIPNAILKLVPLNVAEKHTILPIQYSSKEKALSVVTTDPLNVGLLDEIKFASGIGIIKPLVAIQSAIKAGIEKFYKGNDRAFDSNVSVEDSQDSAEPDFSGTVPIMEGSGEIEIESAGETRKMADRDEPLEISTDEEFVRTEARPAKPKKEKPKKQEIQIDFSEGNEDSVFLGGLDEFPGDNNLSRDPFDQVPSVEVEVEEENQPEPRQPAQPPVAAPSAASKDKPKDQKKYLKRMLVVEPHDQIRKFILKLFHREGFEAEGVENRESVFPAIDYEDYNYIVIKEKNAGEGSEFEEKLRQIKPNIEVHIIKDYGSAMIGETRLYNKLFESFFESLDVIIGLMEMDREGYQGHTHLVVKYCKLIGQKMGISRQEINETIMSAYVHDLGKKGLTHYTLVHSLGPGFDQETLKDSVEIPVKLLSSANLPMDLRRAVSNSLERFDGKGYPGKLSGEDIPLSGRILSVVDSFAFLLAEGWEGHKYEITDAVAFLQEQSGKLFDPAIVETIAQTVKDDLFVGKMDSAKEHILIADHEQGFTTLLESKFVNAGYRVTSAKNGEEALQKAATSRPDFILCEIDLPKMSGFDFIEKLQKSEVGEVPFIFLSSKDDSRIITKSFDLGAEDVISKPVRSEVLFAKVNRIMERIKRSKKAAAPAGQKAGVSGNLSEMSLPDIVQILGAGRRTCLLGIHHDSEKAEIYLEEGRIVNTVYKEIKGEEAFYAIIGWDSGTFDINPDVEINERLINKNNDSLLLEGFRRLDEGGRDASPDDVNVDGGDFF